MLNLSEMYNKRFCCISGNVLPNLCGDFNHIACIMKDKQCLKFWHK